MPKTIEENGQTIEVFTVEEVQAREKAAVDAQVKPLQDQLAAKEDELKKLANKDLNFGNLRQAKEDLEKQIGELKTQIDNAGKDVDAKINKGILDRTVESAIKRLSGGDTAVADKIQHHYDRLKDVADTPEAAEKKLRDAYVLATGAPNDVSIAQAFGSGGAGAPAAPAGGGGGDEKKKSATEAIDRNPTVAANLGITKEDVDKHLKS